MDGWSERYAHAGRRAWSAAAPTWGIWQAPESELRVLPDVAGKDVLEAGCGTAYFSAWVARRGARVIGLDNSLRQLATARRLQDEFKIHFPLLQADAESIPLPDNRFDVVLSEYGASIWCDPYRWVPEAARVLRPGGELIFLRNSTLLLLCMPDPEAGLTAGEKLVRDHFGLYRIEWSDDHSIEFALPHGEWIALSRACGLSIERLIEIQAPPDAQTQHTHVSPQWAHRWPTEEIWKLRKEA